MNSHVRLMGFVRLFDVQWTLHWYVNTTGRSAKVRILN